MKTITFSFFLFMGLYVGTITAQIVKPRIVDPAQMNPHNSQQKGFVITPAAGEAEFITKKLFGNCVDVFNVSLLSGSAKTANAIGVFNDNTNTIGLDSGMLITSGDAMLAIGPNNSGSAGIDNGNPGDSLAGTLIPGFTTYDATVFEFDFIPLADTILAFDFVFASEEYPEFVNSSFNDVFGFFISGPGYNGSENIAFIPGTNIPVSIDNVNAGLNSQYYVDNTTGITLQYDGFTTPIQIVAPVIPLQQYHFKVVIADAGDGIFDSGVFIQAGSFAGVSVPPSSGFSYVVDNNTVSFINESVGANTYLWNFGDGATSTEQNPVHTYSSKTIYNATLTASNYCFSTDNQQAIAITSTGIKPIQSVEFTINNTGKDGYFSYTSNITGKKDIKIFNAEGQLVSSEINYDNSGTLDLSKFSEGIYVIKIISGEQVITNKVIR